LVFFAFSAIFAFFAWHFWSARKGRSLSLAARCAFVMTNAQRARPKRGWSIRKGGNNLKSADFSSPERCAFAITKAQRASYVRRPIMCST
jgi:hypothetical protein